MLENSSATFTYALFTRQPDGIGSIEVIMKDYFVKKCSDFMDVLRGEAIIDDSRMLVPKNIAIKRIRFDPTDDDMKKEILSTLTLAKGMWFSLSHPNICPVWFLMLSGQPVPAIAMPWFNNGNVLNFTRKNPGIDKLDIVKQVARAISYIHSIGIVHGNVVPANVMINDAGMPCLCDVDLDARLRKVIYNAAWPVPSGWQFKAPEELSPPCDPSIFSVTKEMDVYAFASTIYTIFTSKPPFPARPYGRVMKIIHGGHVPEKSTEISDQLWVLLQKCWSYNPGDRPSMVMVILQLEMM